MAATALQLKPEPSAVGCYESKVQELTDVIARHSPRFRRIALRSSEQCSRRGGCSAGRFALGLYTRASVQGTSEDGDLADDDRNQLCTNETTSACVGASGFGRNRSAAGFQAGRHCVRYPARA